MQEPEDIVWNAITNSAKTRFDYTAFEKMCRDVGDPNVIENFLFMIIAGFADGLSKDEIASEIKRELLMIGFGFQGASLEQFLEDKESLFKNEILATEMAMSFFDQGIKPHGVLIAVRKILGT